MAPKAGDGLLSLRHFKVSKSPKPLAAIDILPAVSGAVDKTVDILNVFQYGSFNKPSLNIQSTNLLSQD